MGKFDISLHKKYEDMYRVKHFLFSILIIICICPVYTFAAANASYNTVLVLRGQGQTSRPHSPNKNVITVYYENGKLSFSMPSGVEYLHVTITDEDSGARSSAFVYSENDEVDLPSNGINYYITVTTNTSITFEGELPIINN